MMEMTSRERVFTALEHKTPDRCPVDFWAESTTLQTLFKYFGVSSEEALLDIFDVDLQFVGPRSLGKPSVTLPDGGFENPDGSRYRFVKNDSCAYAECVYRPLEDMETVDEVRTYDKWPDADAFDWDHFAEDIGKRHEKRVIKLFTGGLFERAWGLRGQENFLTDMILSPDIPHYIMGKLTDYFIDYVRHAMDAAGDLIDIVYTYDDIATQKSLIMSHEMLEEFVYPYHRKLNAVIRHYGKRVLYHSCGAVFPEIPSLMSHPIDILNPLQPLAAGMDLQKIKDTYGSVLSFHGGIDIQELLPHGSPEEVKNAVRRAISILGKDGGYIMTAAHNIQNDTPVENIIAMYDPALR